MTAKASDHWERDWEAFKNALSVMKVGYGVYNFPVWDEGEEGTTFAVMPTFVTYLDPNADIEWLYHGGSYLGGAAIAAKCTGKDMLRVKADDSYVTACTRLTGNEQACKAVVDDVCPFADTPTSPCYCDGEMRTDFVRQSINPECCDQIKAWCAQPANTQGCSTYAVEHYDSKCDEGYHDLERVQTLLLENFEDEDDLCLEECANSCKYVENNYKKCSACATNLATHTYASGSFAASCYPGAIGFVNHRCCGTGDSRQTCAAFSEANDCALVSHVDDGCMWMEHTECAAKITAAREAAEAQRLLDEAAAAEPEEEPAVEEEPVVVEEEIVPE